VRNQIIESLKSHAVGKINRHKMNVEVYLENPSGIGEHSDIMGAIEEELRFIADYHEQLEILERYF
jgi:rRNA processing protein Gar1